MAWSRGGFKTALLPYRLYIRLYIRAKARLV
jgi:hypothetical protein